MGKVKNIITAKSLGIEWLDHNCSDKPFAPFAHHLEAGISVSGGDIYICRYCHKAKWMPNSLSDCRKLYYYQRYHGDNDGYCKLLDEHPAARDALAILLDTVALGR